MDLDVNDMVEIIDLCTPDVGDMHEISTKSTPVLIQNGSTSSIWVERFPSLSHRLSILPCYPTNERQVQIMHPLLANIPRL